MLDYFTDRAERGEPKRRFQRGFFRQRAAIIRHYIGGRQRVLEWGCGSGELLAALDAGERVGRDFCPAMVARARQQHPEIRFEEADIMRPPSGQTQPFEVILMDYLAPYLPDVQQAFAHARAEAAPETRLIVTSLNALFAPFLGCLHRMGLCEPVADMNWLSRADIRNLLELSGWEVLTERAEQLLPLQVPVLAPLCNRWFARLPLLRHFATSLVLVARPKPGPSRCEALPSCSVVVPARNEAGNIAAALQRIPVMGAWTEVIFVEGHSADDTWPAIQREVAGYNGPLRLRCLQQPGRGKWDAVRAGFAVARGDYLVIQDADLTAPPEDLTKFFAALFDGSAEFANGSRLVYPMEKRAMRFLNLLGNKFFAEALSLVLGQRIKDSLCGTKMVRRRDYQRLIPLVEHQMGDFDPFGDFNLLFGASLDQLKIRDIPVRYAERSYGATNISRFRHGAVLFKMIWKGLWALYFYPIRPRKPKPAP